MENNIMSEFQKILRGKNGSIFFVILAIVAVLVFIKVIPALISFLVIAALIFLVFRYFESKK
jgi:large-conductance mechanosensitive channel